IHALGIRAVFGLMSDDTAVFAVTLDGLGVKFVGARHENNAIAMAEGYAYSTGELGVALIGRGPATANGLHAAVGASRKGSKVQGWGPAPKITPASQPTGARRQSIDAAAALLSKSRRPVIVAGMGAHRAGAKPALQALAEKTGALLMTSARGKDMFHGHPCNLAILGSFSHTMGRHMMDQADCVLVFGAGLNFLTM